MLSKNAALRGTDFLAQLGHGPFSDLFDQRMVIKNLTGTSDTSLTIEMPDSSTLPVKSVPKVPCKKLRQLFRMNLSTYELQDKKLSLQQILTWSDAKLERFLQRAVQTVKSTQSAEKAHYLGQLSFYLAKIRKVQFKSTHTKQAISINRCIKSILANYKARLAADHFDLGNSRTNNHPDNSQHLLAISELFPNGLDTENNSLLTDPEFSTEANFYNQDYLLQKRWFKQDRLYVEGSDEQAGFTVTVKPPNQERLFLSHRPRITDLGLRQLLGLDLSTFELKFPHNDFCCMMKWTDKKLYRFIKRAENTQLWTKSYKKADYLGRCAHFLLMNKQEYLQSKNTKEAKQMLILLTRMVEFYKKNLREHQCPNPSEGGLLVTYDDAPPAYADLTEERPPDYDLIVQEPQTETTKRAIKFAADHNVRTTGLPRYEDLN